ncbi:MAG: GHMP kinase, partial [Gammaproteobacteria bacterium]
SARLSQQILYKPQFEQLLAETRELGALGVNCAHSGTVLGVLHRADEALTHALVGRIEASFGPSLRIHGDFRVIGGGCHACN